MGVRTVNVIVRVVRSSLSTFIGIVGLAIMAFEIVVRLVTGTWIPLK